MLIYHTIIIDKFNGETMTKGLNSNCQTELCKKHFAIFQTKHLINF